MLRIGTFRLEFDRRLGFLERGRDIQADAFTGELVEGGDVLVDLPGRRLVVDRERRLLQAFQPVPFGLQLPQLASERPRAHPGDERTQGVPEFSEAVPDEVKGIGQEIEELVRHGDRTEHGLAHEEADDGPEYRDQGPCENEPGGAERPGDGLAFRSLPSEVGEVGGRLRRNRGMRTELIERLDGIEGRKRSFHLAGGRHFPGTVSRTAFAERGGRGRRAFGIPREGRGAIHRRAVSGGEKPEMGIDRQRTVLGRELFRRKGAGDRRIHHLDADLFVPVPVEIAFFRGEIAFQAGIEAVVRGAVVQDGVGDGAEDEEQNADDPTEPWGVFGRLWGRHGVSGWVGRGAIG